MKRKIAQGSSLYAYLDSLNIFETGTEAEIQQARKKYWSMYKRAWKKKRKQSMRSFSVSFDESQLKVLTDVAAKYGVSRSRLIQLSTLAYVQKLLPCFEIFMRMQQMMSMQYMAIMRAVEDGAVPSLAGVLMLKKIEDLEKCVMSELESLKSVTNDH